MKRIQYTEVQIVKLYKKSKLAQRPVRYAAGSA
jgi:hypothetical protein